MPQEIERKFLVNLSKWQPQGQPEFYKQGYLSSRRDCVVRVRIAGARGQLTIKGATTGIARAEFEYPIPTGDAEVMLETLCERPIIEKFRHTEQHHGLTWEIDVFRGDNDGLVVAEIELSSADQTIELPAWAGLEVSDDPRYFNSNLLKHPFKRWAP